MDQQRGSRLPLHSQPSARRTSEATAGPSASASSSHIPPPSRFGFSGTAAGATRLSNGVSSAAVGVPRPSSRLGVGSGSSSVAGPSQAILGNKRSLSGAGLQSPSTPLAGNQTDESAENGASTHLAKRRQHSTSSSTGTTMTAVASSRGPTPSLSHDFSTLESEYKRREILAQQAYEKLQQEYMARAREADKHQQDRIALLRQWETFNAEIEEERQTAARQRAQLSEQVKVLQSKQEELVLQANRAEGEAAKARQAAHATKTDLSLRVSTLEAELATSQAEAENNKQHRVQLQHQLNEQEADFARERQSLHAQSTDEIKSHALTTELSSLLSKSRKLETDNLVLAQENKSLMTQRDSVQALKEHNRSLERKVSAVDELRRNLAMSEATTKELEDELDRWRSLSLHHRDMNSLESTHVAFADPGAPVPPIPEPTSFTPDAMIPYISRLQGAISGLSTRAQSLSERVASYKRQGAEAEKFAQEGLDKCGKLEMDLQRSKMSQLASEKGRETIAMELESYKKLLDTFQQEAQNMSGQYNASLAEQISVLEAQLSAREKSLDEALERLKLAEEKLGAFTASGSISSTERSQLESESEERYKTLLRTLEEQQTAYAALEKQCVSLGKANDDLFARLGRGEFDQSKLRCLEVSQNPVSNDRVIRTSTLERLRKENDELLHQVQELSKQVSLPTDDLDETSRAGMIPAQTLENLRQEYANLEQTMRNRDKAFDRLKQVFGAKAGEYVAAVKTLFGYDMHVVAKGKIKLRSVYARTSKGTSLTFDSADDDVGSMRLVGEARAGAANVAHLKKYWLNSADRSSVPCFLAALQLELYESTTQAARSGWAGDEDEEAE